MPSSDKFVNFPKTEKEFDDLVKRVVKKFGFKNEEHAAAVIATRIAHSAVDQATTTLEYLGACVHRNISFQLAQSRMSKMQHQAQVDQIVATLQADLNDQQARDALEKAMAEGSEYAKDAHSKLFGALP